MVTHSTYRFDHAYLVCQIILSLVYFLSFCTKARDVNGFLQAVKEYGILGSRGSSLYVSLVVPLELLLSLSHFTGYFLLVAAPVGVALLFSFLIATSAAYRNHQHIPCHCFDSLETVSIRTLFRLVLIILAEIEVSASLWLHFPRPSIVGATNSLSELQVAIPYASLLLIVAIWLFSIPELTTILSKPFWHTRRVAG